VESPLKEYEEYEAIQFLSFHEVYGFINKNFDGMPILRKILLVGIKLTIMPSQFP